MVNLPFVAAETNLVVCWTSDWKEVRLFINVNTTFYPWRKSWMFHPSISSWRHLEWLWVKTNTKGNRPISSKIWHFRSKNLKMTLYQLTEAAISLSRNFSVYCILNAFACTHISTFRFILIFENWCSGSDSIYQYWHFNSLGK